MSRRLVHLGRSAFEALEQDDVQVELGYQVSPDHRQRGHAIAAVGLLLDRARRELTSNE